MIPKFRVWDKKEKKMHKVCRLGLNGFSHDFWSPNPVACDSRMDDKDRYVFQQFTGLSDKNGVELYSGDKVKSGDDIFVIFWKDSHARFAIKRITGIRNGEMTWHILLFDGEKIGDIHSDPLEEKDEGI